MKHTKLLDLIKSYPDFPKKGIIFRDISPLLADASAFALALDLLQAKAKKMPQFNKILAIDARGFIFGGVLADRLKKGLIICRKPNKLPGSLIEEKYGYEYSSDVLTIQRDAIIAGDRILIVDDVLASGNTLLAAGQLVQKLGGEVSGILCLLELNYLKGRELVAGNINQIEAILKIES